MSRAAFRSMAVIAVAFALDAGPAWAWSHEGHLIICEIAWQRLSPEARSFVNGVRSHAAAHRDGRAMRFNEGCVWPDEAREDTFRDTYEYHFVNVPESAASFDLQRDCGRLDCVVAGIQRYAQYVAAAPANSRERERQALALRFLGHFVGDLHQPLHTGFAEDLGGNLTNVRVNQGTATITRPLHLVWDVDVLARAGLDTVQDAKALNGAITSAQAAEWAAMSPVSWTQESHALARRFAYRRPDGSVVQTGDLLDSAYLDAAMDVARLQLQRAGVRLAALIEAAAAGTLPPDLVKGGLLTAWLNPSPAVAGEPVAVMSFNIRYGTAADGDNSWTLRRAHLFDVLRAHDADIVGLQEALGFQIAEILAAVPSYTAIGVGREDGRAAGEYSAILVRRDRFRVAEAGTFWFSDTPDVPGSASWGNRITRICTWARLVDRDGTAFRVFNVHLDHESQPSRERSTALLAERIAARTPPDEPVIVTGDFNAGEDNPAMRALVPGAFVDTFRVLHPGEAAVGTFNGFTLGQVDGPKIDYVLVQPGVEVLSAAIDRSSRDGKYPSDHFPVVARIRLPARP